MVSAAKLTGDFGVYRGFCRRCGTRHSLQHDAPNAVGHLEKLFAELETPALSRERDAMVQGEGKMVGVLFGTDANGTTKALRGFSGDLLGRSAWDGWVPSIMIRSKTAELEAVTMRELAALTRQLESIVDEKEM